MICTEGNGEDTVDENKREEALRRRDILSIAKVYQEMEKEG